MLQNLRSGIISHDVQLESFEPVSVIMEDATAKSICRLAKKENQRNSVPEIEETSQIWFKHRNAKRSFGSGKAFRWSISDLFRSYEDIDLLKVNCPDYMWQVLRIYSESHKESTFDEFFVQFSDTLMRPYIRCKNRVVLESGKNLPPKFKAILESGQLQTGDIIHVPFSSSEKTLFDKLLLQNSKFDSEIDLSAIIVIVADNIKTYRLIIS